MAQTIEVGTGTGANQVLGSGTQQNVPAGASFNVTANWTAVPGQRGFLGTADPNNTLHESSNQNRQNNYKDFPVNVPQMSAATQGSGGTPPPQVTRTIEWQKAKNAGASFPTNFDGFPGTCAKDTSDTTQLPAGSDQFAFSLGCFTNGGKANFDAYSGFTLKHGWHVKRYDVSEIRKDPGTGWRWDSTPPNAGATSPYVRFHMYVPSSTGSVILAIKITIEGPDGTDPYQ